MSMLETVKRLLNVGKKQILLSVPAFFPSWHRRFGDETCFRERLLDKQHPKIHAISLHAEFWQKMEEKYRTGKYQLLVCHMDDNPECRKYRPIMYANQLHVQRACFVSDDIFLVVEGKSIAMETIARNEGLEMPDLLEWKKRLGTKEFCIVHFTAFSY